MFNAKIDKLLTELSKYCQQSKWKGKQAEWMQPINKIFKTNDSEEENDAVCMFCDHNFINYTKGELWVTFLMSCVLKPKKMNQFAVLTDNFFDFAVFSSVSFYVSCFKIHPVIKSDPGVIFALSLLFIYSATYFGVTGAICMSNRAKYCM